MIRTFTGAEGCIPLAYRSIGLGHADDATYPVLLRLNGSGLIPPVCAQVSARAANVYGARRGGFDEAVGTGALFPLPSACRQPG